MKNGQTFWNWLKYDGKYIPKNIKRGIKNLIKWFPLVWNDADWDDYYIMVALKFKIENTANYIDYHKRHENYEYDVQKMRVCVRLIDKIIDSYYETEYQDYDENCQFTFNKKHKSYKLKDFFEKYPNDYRRALKKINSNKSDINIALSMGTNRHMRANQLLFNILQNNIYKWWD